MVVGYLDVVSVSIDPLKADSKLVVDTDAVLAGPVAFQFFEAKSWQVQSGQGNGAVEKVQSDLRLASDSLESTAELAVDHRLRLLVFNGSDHSYRVYPIALYVTEYPW
jgi:hypothetical protein